MKTDSIKPIIERSRNGADDRGSSGVWRGWSKRRMAMSAYLGSQFIACLFVVALLKLFFPLYSELHYQIAAVQAVLVIICFVWFVPAMVDDFQSATRRSGARTGASSLTSAVSSLAKNIVFLSLLSGISTLPFALLFPSGDVVGHSFYTSSFKLMWGFHVLLACSLQAIFTAISVSIGCAVMMLVRSLHVYRLIALFFVITAMVSVQPVYNVLSGLGLVLRYGRFTDKYWSFGQLSFIGYFREAISAVDGGSYLLNHIPTFSGKVMVAVLTRLIFAAFMVPLFLWIGAGLYSLTSGLFRGRAAQISRAVARPWLSFLTSVAGMGAVATVLLHNTSYLLVTSYRIGQRSTPYDMMLLALLIAVIYIVVSAASDALQSASHSGMGDSLRVIIWRLLHGGAGLVLAAIFTGMFFLALFAKMAGYGAAELVAAFGLSVLAGAVALTCAAAVLVLGRLTRNLWGGGTMLQGFTVFLAISWSVFLLFTRRPAESLIQLVQGDPALLAARQADEVSKLSASSYPSLVHSWLRSFDVNATNLAGMVQLALAVLAVVAAVVLALSLLSRLTRRLA